ncbi:MAG: SurA N-terminal domain-containing protein, partial [Halieaceae bacterium]
MLQTLRKNLQGTIAKIIVAIIVVPFALFGIESLVSGGGIQYVAEVNGEKISAVELQQQVNQQKRRLLMTMGDSIDPSMLDDQMLAAPALEMIIQKSLLTQAAASYGLSIADERLGEFIASMEAFQIDGRFDPNLFRQIVSDQGYSPAGFQEALREDLIMSQLRAGVAGSSFATELEVEQLAAIKQEQRDIRYTILPLEQFRTDAAISEEDILAWYETNQALYMTDESVQLDYIELTVDDFRKPVDESEMLAVYESEKDSFQLAEERRVSHILIEQGADESDEAVQQRLEAAQQRTAEADESFAVLAETLSDDVGSASIGGDLGFTAGDAFPEEMEAVIASLSLDQVSAPVQTDAGWHLIKLTEVRAGQSRSFADVRAELEARLQDEQASRDLVKSVESLR